MISSLMMLMACGGKKAQTDSTDAVIADSTVMDSAAVVIENPYDFEAIAKAIEGCEYLENFSHGVARVKKDGQNFYIDLHGNIVEEPKVEENPDELRCDYENGKYGFKDNKGNVVIPHQFHFAHDFSDGMAIVVNEIGEVGYINTKGELAIPYQYDTMAESDGNNFHEGLCAVVVDGSHEWVSYIDKTGKLAFEGVFSYGGDFSEGLAAVSTTGENARSGYIDHDGKMVIDLPEGTAKRTVELAKEAGVVFTGAGATYPYKKDPHDSNVRIAPSYPPVNELGVAMNVFCCCAKIAWAEKELSCKE